MPLNSSVVQSERSFRSVVGPLPRRVCKTFAMSASSSFALAIHSCRSTSIKFMKRCSGNTMTSELSLSSSGQISGLLERASDNTIFVPGTCTNLMSNSERYNDHLACLRLSFLASR